MCGIAGIWSLSIKPSIAKRGVSIASHALSHRGPDSSGNWSDESKGIYFGHRRLSIIDLSNAANQPMHSGSGKSTIIFNGEIYNYIELQKELQGLGIPLKTKSDTEVILELYEHFGISAFEKLRGMFALAIWDASKRNLVLARDRVGKKPLFFLKTNHGIYFASEVQAITEIIPDNEISISEESVIDYLTWGAPKGENSIFKGIKKIAPSSYTIFNNGNEIKSGRYAHSPLDTSSWVGTFNSLVEEVDEKISESVKLRLRSDVPVGLFLSGGIDSGIITAIAASESGHPIKTFSIGSFDPALDERASARIISEAFNTQHHELTLDDFNPERTLEIISAYGEPIADPSIIPSYILSEFVSGQCKVVLNGDGGDEAFGGYRRHLAAYWIDRIESLIPSKISRAASLGLLALLSQPTRARGTYPFLYRMLKVIASSPIERTVSLSSDGFTPHILTDLGCHINHHVIHKMSEDMLLNQMMHADYEYGLPDILLPKIDIATMRHGLEGRSPLLDQEVLKVGFSIPTNFRFKGNQTKAVLRTVAEKYLPKNTTKLPKRGFEVPVYDWINGSLRSLVFDTVSTSKIVRNIFEHKKVMQLLDGSFNSRYGITRRNKLVWLIFCLAAWDIQRIQQSRNANNNIGAVVTLGT